jgi:quercetin dioxygenase-like cupin family protein
MPFIDSKDLERKAPLPGWEGRFFHSPSLTFAYYSIAAGSEIHEHEHENEEVWHVLEGALEFTLDGEVRVLGPGCAAVVPSNTLHFARALEDTRAIVVDHPRRSRVGGVEI